MPDFLWETHLHTAEASRCGEADAASLVRAYKSAGFHGVVVTDHFFNGNSRARPHHRWQKKVDILFRGYLAALKEGEALGVAVLLGWEYAYHGGDYLTYGLDEAFLRDQPDLCDITLEDYIGRVQAAGGLVSQAHPFRSAWYLPEPTPKSWDIVDAFEVFNGSHSAADRRWDDNALDMARKHNLIETAGSDVHDLAGVATAALAFPEPFGSARDFLSALRAREGRVVRRRG